MANLKHLLLTTILLASPAYALESADSAPVEKEAIEQPQNGEHVSDKDSSKVEKTDLHKHHHRKHLSKRPYKKPIDPNTEAQTAEEGSPHKHVYQKHTSKRPHSKNVSH